MLPFERHPFRRENVKAVLTRSQLYGMGHHVEKTAVAAVMKAMHQKQMRATRLPSSLDFNFDEADPYEERGDNGPQHIVLHEPRNATTHTSIVGSGTEQEECRFDRWGREKTTHIEGMRGGNTLFFLHDDEAAWDRVLDFQSVPNKKKRLDEIFTNEYRDRVLRQGQNSDYLACAFYSRAQLALEHYCNIRKWSYGYDILLVCKGRAIGESGLPPWKLMPKAAADNFYKTNGFASCPWSEHSYEVLIGRQDAGVRFDVKRLMLYVMYSVEMLMRKDEYVNWFISDKDMEGYLEKGLMARLKEVDPSITGAANSVARHSDAGVYNIRPVDASEERSNTRKTCHHGVQGTVVKNCSALVYPPLSEQRRNQGQKPDRAQLLANNKETLDITEARYATGTTKSIFVTSNEDNMYMSSDATDSMNLMCDFTVKYVDNNDNDKDGEKEKKIRSTAKILSVDIPAASNWRPGYIMNEIRRDPMRVTKHIIVRGVDIVVPGTEMAWEAAMQGLFEWMNRAALMIQPVTASIAKEKAVRMFWWSALLMFEQLKTENSSGPKRKLQWIPMDHLSTTNHSAHFKGNKRSKLAASAAAASAAAASTSTTVEPTVLPSVAVPSVAPSVEPAPAPSRVISIDAETKMNQKKMSEVVDTLQRFQMGISVPDQVHVAGMSESLSHPFDKVWNAANLLMDTMLVDEGNEIWKSKRCAQRTWFKELLASSAVTVSAALSMNNTFA